jgi:hypothetical protein
MAQIEIRQIYYERGGLAQVPTCFFPLNNLEGDKSWFEFWPMLNFLDDIELEENVFYGFLSPKFSLKTGLTPESTITAVAENCDKDAILFSYKWEVLCFFLNPWEQGEVWHKGISRETQLFLDDTGINIDIPTLVTSRKSAVFSNFIIAKRCYWRRWQELASKFLLYADDPSSGLSAKSTPYKGTELPMKVFIQERLPSLILTDQSLSVTTIDVNTGLTSPFFVDSPENRKRLIACDEVKDEMIQHGVTKHLMDEFENLRKGVLLVGASGLRVSSIFD